MANLATLLDRLRKLWHLSPRLIGRVPQAWRVFRKAGRRGVEWELRRRLRPAADYMRWVERHDRPTPDSRHASVERLAALKSRPLISVLMPTFNPDPRWFQAAVDSVRAQGYPDWELCIADDASTELHVRDLLMRCAASDSRIKVVFRPRNGHISAASNSALEMVRGAWIALMDHDDLLAEDALLQVAKCIAAHPDARLIYSDEDKVDADGIRSDPYFKPDWNPDLFRSHNLFSHLGVLATGLVREVGGFREGFEGSQDWDLVMRCVERIGPHQVRHIPRVLYHWRVHEQSTARSMAAKPYAAVAGERALAEHYQRIGLRAAVEYVGFGYRTRHLLPDPAPLVSIVIPTRNAHALVRRCIESIRRLTRYRPYEIVLVDNGSDEPASLACFAELDRSSDIRLLRQDGDFNFSALNNAAVATARGEVVALLNNDVEVLSPDWLGEMVGLALQPEVGAVGARLWYPDRTLQHGGIVLAPGGVAMHAHKGLPRGLNGYAGRAALVQSFSAVTAACLVVRKAVYLAVGGLDAVHLKVAYNDVDFCLRLRKAGYRTVWTPFAELVHHESATRGDDVSPARRERLDAEAAVMRARWGDVIDDDPAYNPNLVADSEDFGYAWPPRHRAP